MAGRLQKGERCSSPILIIAEERAETAFDRRLKNATAVHYKALGLRRAAQKKATPTTDGQGRPNRTAVPAQIRPLRSQKPPLI